MKLEHSNMIELIRTLDLESLSIEELLNLSQKRLYDSEGTEKIIPTIEDYIKIVGESPKNDLPEQYQNWLKLYDEFASWFVNLTMFMTIRIMEKTIKKTDKDRALLPIIANISAQMIAIRRLVNCGLDIQAKQLVRVLVEHLDLAVLISQNETIATKFMQTTGGDEANKFWHSHIKGGKLRRDFHGNIREKLGDNEYKEFMNFFNEEEKILGMVIHPSITACQMALFPGSWQGGDRVLDLMEFCGAPTLFSTRTLSYVALYTVFYLIIGYIPEKHFPRGKNKQKLFGAVQDYIHKSHSELFIIQLCMVKNWKRSDLHTSMDIREGKDK